MLLRSGVCCDLRVACCRFVIQDVAPSILTRWRVFYGSLLSAGSCPAGFAGTGLTSCVDINEVRVIDKPFPIGCRSLQRSSFWVPCCDSRPDFDEFACCFVLYLQCSFLNGACDTLTNCTNTPGSRNCGNCPAGEPRCPLQHRLCVPFVV